MIFPHLPKYYQWQQTAPELSVNRDPVEIQAEPCTAKTPLRHSGAISMEEWFDQHGYSTGPAAVSARKTEPEPINWLARDAWEFYALCIGMLCWIVYWYGVHMGVW
jgi:hypothetical protein